jgi:hypothetical protein
LESLDIPTYTDANASDMFEQRMLWGREEAVDMAFTLGEKWFDE